MGNVLRLAIADPDENSRENLKNLLLGMDSVWLEAECSRYEYFMDVVEQSSPDVAVVAVDQDIAKAISLIQQLRDSSDCSVVVVSSSNDGSLILQAMRAGAKEFLTQPLSVDIPHQVFFSQITRLAFIFKHRQSHFSLLSQI